MGSHHSTSRVQQRFTGDGGASLVEYALLLALIAVVCIASLTYFQQQTSKSLSRSASTIAG
jgi:Flp pilus assembly pilin Flp